jgi:hypothetical protein
MVITGQKTHRRHQQNAQFLTIWNFFLLTKKSWKERHTSFRFAPCCDSVVTQQGSVFTSQSHGVNRLSSSCCSRARAFACYSRATVARVACCGGSFCTSNTITCYHALPRCSAFFALPAVVQQPRPSCTVAFLLLTLLLLLLSID